MGIPKFYRWLSERYPRINQKIDNSELPEFDAMYLDANGIIHVCSHPNDEEVSDFIPFPEMVKNICAYIDKMVHTINPRKVLYIAIDGCAPRAKMNQQRTRRFASAREREEKHKKEIEEGKITAADAENMFDSNVITPGTAFMAEVSLHLEFFLRYKLKEDPAYQHLEIYYSGHDVPGEGEHKIMDFIRHRRMQPGYDPNTRHCLCGLDADLVMLGLASHEPHFALLREEVDFLQGGRGHPSDGKPVQTTKVVKRQVSQERWQLLHLSALRDYLDLEYGQAFKGRLSFLYDLERVLDDWILLAMLVGNDFLPPLPSMRIVEGGLDALFELYKEILPTLDGYLTTPEGGINLNRLERVFAMLGMMEADILEKREKDIEQFVKKHTKRGRGGAAAAAAAGQSSVAAETIAAIANALADRLQLEVDEEDVEALRRTELRKSNGSSNHYGTDSTPTPPQPEDAGDEILASPAGKSREDGAMDDNDEDSFLVGGDSLAVVRNIKTPPAHPSETGAGWERKKKYYADRFGVSFDSRPEEARAIVNSLVRYYLEGLTWCMKYYYQGVPSWVWFYPAHYAPLPSDMRRLSSISLTMEYGAPFNPFTQLMACLPASSAACLPPCYRALMTDPNSPIASFYPTQWEVDTRDTTKAYEGISLLPFIDEALLKHAIAERCPDSLLTPSELARNQFGKTYVYRHDAKNTSSLDARPLSTKIFSSLTECRSSKAVYELPHMEKNVAVILPGYARTPGDPVLKDHELLEPSSCRLESVELNCFGRPSKRETFVLGMRPFIHQRLDEYFASHFLVPQRHEQKRDVPAWINFPYLHEAMVMAMADTEARYEREEPWGAFTKRPNTGAERRAIEVEALNSLALSLRGTKEVGSGGISFANDACIMLFVKPLTGMEENRLTGRRTRAFKGGEKSARWIPANLVTFVNPHPDPRFMDRAPDPLWVRFPEGSKVISVGAKGYGMLGEVSDAHSSTTTVTCRFPSTAAKSVADFAHVIASSVIDVYYPLAKVAQVLGVDPKIADKILGSLHVREDDSRYSSENDLGLNLRVRGDHVVPHYARCTASEAAKPAWGRGDAYDRVAGLKMKEDSANGKRGGGTAASFEYTERAVALAQTYVAKFPKVIAYLKSHPDEVVYNARDLFGSGAQGDAAHAALVRWLQQLPTHKAALVPITSRFMSRDALVALQRAVDEVVAAERALVASAPPREVALSPHVLARPPGPRPGGARGWTESPTAEVVPSLGDRVLNLGNELAPFGLRGTVVGVHPSTSFVEVLFDQSFTGGTTLSGLAPRPGHGALMRNADLLNLSKKKPVEDPDEGETAEEEAAVAARARHLPAEHLRSFVAREETHQGPRQPNVTPITTKPGSSATTTTTTRIATTPATAVKPPVTSGKPLTKHHHVTEEVEEEEEGDDALANLWVGLLNIPSGTPSATPAKVHAEGKPAAKQKEPRAKAISAANATAATATKPQGATTKGAERVKKPYQRQQQEVTPTKATIAPPTVVQPAVSTVVATTPPPPVVAKLGKIDALISRAHQTEGRHYQSTPPAGFFSPGSDPTTTAPVMSPPHPGTVMNPGMMTMSFPQPSPMMMPPPYVGAPIPVPGFYAPAPPMPVRVVVPAPAPPPPPTTIVIVTPTTPSGSTPIKPSTSTLPETAAESR